MSIKLEIPIIKEYDVAVIGGGTAGVFAAHSAALSGAKTILIEKTGMLGGTMTNSYVNYPGIFQFWHKHFITGPCWDVMLRLEAAGAAQMPANEYAPKRFSSQQIRLDPFLLAVELERLVRGSGAEILMHTMLSHAEETEGGVRLVFTGKEGMWCAFAKRVVDATGDANVASMLGYEVMRSEVLQPATYANRLEGYCIDEIDECEVLEKFERAFEEGYLDRRYFSWKTPYDMLKRRKMDMHIPCVGAEDSASKTALELEGHEFLARALEIYRSIRGCEKIKVKAFSAECGIRETCRIVGEETMTVDKYLSGHVYDDAISYCFYAVDVHTLDGLKITHLEPEVVPTIPYRALIPRGSHYVIVAGRTVSSDTETNSAVRVQAPCMAMGTAAGIAAAIAAGDGARFIDVDYGRLTDRLRAIGATVPQK